MLKIVTQRTYSLFALTATEQLRPRCPSSPCRDLALSVDGTLLVQLSFSGRMRQFRFSFVTCPLFCAPLNSLPWMLNWPIKRQSRSNRRPANYRTELSNSLRCDYTNHENIAHIIQNFLIFIKSSHWLSNEIWMINNKYNYSWFDEYFE